MTELKDIYTLVFIGLSSFNLVAVVVKCSRKMDDLFKRCLHGDIIIVVTQTNAINKFYTHQDEFL